MDTDNKKNLIVKFPEDKSPSSLTNTAPNNPVDKAADFLPRALASIKENFKEAVFLFGILGYVFIAAFGHMEKISNYTGYFFIFLVGIIFYNIWNKITSKDFLYWFIIVILIIYVLYIRFNISVVNWF